jgi:hypothetical protein
MPYTIWLWLGGGLIAVGTVLAAFPGRRRRRPTDPVSAPTSDRVPAESRPDERELVTARRLGRLGAVGGAAADV